MVIIRNIPARDQLPGQKDYSHLLIATATAGSEADRDHGIGNLTNPAENLSWRAQGPLVNQWASIEFPESCRVMRIDIEWDPALPRTGIFDIELWDDDSKVLTISHRQAKNSSLFTMVEIEGENSTCNRVKILFVEGDLNGIATIALYGY